MATMQAVFDLLAKCDCPLLVIGGHALEAHGVSRQTVDVDCLLAADDGDALDVTLKSGGFKRVGATGNFTRYAHESPLMPDVDVLFVDRDTFTKLLAGAVELRRGGHVFLVPGLANFVALKLHAMRNNPAREARDLGDIVELLRKIRPSHAMKSHDADLKLPDWNVPDLPAKQLRGDAYVAWLEENRRELIRSGLLEKLRADPNRCPVDVRFVMH